MKKTVFFALCVLLYGLSGCMKNDNNIEYYSYIPALIGGTISQPLLVTSEASLYAPDLQKHLLSYDLVDGDVVLSWFEIDRDNQPNGDMLTASNVMCAKMEKVRAQRTSGGASLSNDYHFRINNLSFYDAIFDNHLGNFLFIVFEHYAADEDDFVYEMTYEINENDPIPTVYVRAKKTGTGIVSSGNIEYLGAFDITWMVQEMASQGVDSNKIQFNIKFKTGVDDDGNDVFTSWSKNPFVYPS